MKRKVPQPSTKKPSRYIRRIEFRGSRRTRGLGDMSRLYQHHYLAAGRLLHFQMNLLLASRKS